MTRRMMAVMMHLSAIAGPTWAQGVGARGSRRTRATAERVIVLKPQRVWDGVALGAHNDRVVVVRGPVIDAVGPAAEIKVPGEARTIEPPGMTLLPGLINAHTHVLLHPYDEAAWDDQVLKETLALRVCRAITICGARSFPASRPFATWEPKAPVMPT
jgi:adenine deaminase